VCEEAKVFHQNDDFDFEHDDDFARQIVLLENSLGSLKRKLFLGRKVIKTFAINQNLNGEISTSTRHSSSCHFIKSSNCVNDVPAEAFF